MTDIQRIVIVGAAVAGLTAAECLRGQGFSGDILLIGDEVHLPYSRPPLSKQMLLDDWTIDQPTIKNFSELTDIGIQFLGDTQALKLNLREKTILTSRGDFQFDILIIATGAKAKEVDLDHSIPTLRTIDDSITLRTQMKQEKRLAVLGAGVLGSELASAAVALGSSVTLIGRSSSLSFGAVGTTLSSRLERLHLDNGVDLRLNKTLTRVVNDASKKLLKFSDDSELVVDYVVAAIGSSPCANWLYGSGLIIKDGVICNSAGLAAPGVYAIGDVAAWPDPFTGSPVRVEHQSNAIEQAIAVAQNITAGTAPNPPVPFFWSEIHGARIKAYGWFDTEPLSNLEKSSLHGELLGSGGSEYTSGVVAWELPPKDFLKARLLVDSSLAKEKK